jgi:hypothetical protein
MIFVSSRTSSRRSNAIWTPRSKRRSKKDRRTSSCKNYSSIAARNSITVGPKIDGDDGVASHDEVDEVATQLLKNQIAVLLKKGN